MTVLGERKVVCPVECQVVLHVKSRQAAIVRAVIKICHVLNVITEVLRVDSARVVDGSRECVRCLSSEAARESFDHTQLKRIIERLRVAHALPHTDKVGVPPPQLRLEDLFTVHDDPWCQINIAHTDQVIAA